MHAWAPLRAPLKSVPSLPRRRRPAANFPQESQQRCGCLRRVLSRTATRELLHPTSNPTKNGQVASQVKPQLAKHQLPCAACGPYPVTRDQSRPTCIATTTAAPLRGNNNSNSSPPAQQQQQQQPTCAAKATATAAAAHLRGHRVLLHQRLLGQVDLRRNKQGAKWAPM